MRTRNYFTLCVILLLFGTASEAQRRGLSQNQYTSTYYSNDVRYRSYSYNDDRYGTYEDYAYVYDRYYNRMSRVDRRCFNALMERLDKRKRRAWRDGRLSRYDRDRIRSVEIDIEDLIAKYAYDRHRRSRTYRSVCR